MRSSSALVVLISMFASFASYAQLPLGTLAVDGAPTPEQVALVLPVTGTLPTTATATVRYKPTASSTWIIGHPLFRVRPEFADSGGPTVEDVFAWPILDLTPATSYDLEVTVTSAGTSVVKTLTTSTRTLPATSGATTITIAAGSSVSTIQSAINGAPAGAVVEIQDGTYNLSGTLSVQNTNGTNSNPVYVRGASRNGTVLSRSGTVIQLLAMSNVVFERMTLRGSGVDSGVNASSTGVAFFDGVAPQSRVTIRNMTITGVDRGIVAPAEVDEILLYDNTLVGNNQWTQDFYAPASGGAPGAGDGTPDVSQNVFWNDDGIGIPGQSNCAFNNTIKGFGDTFTLSVGSNHPTTRGVFYYRNDSAMSGDDYFEADFGFRNIALYDSRSRNSMTALSLDPLYGGPLVFARNVFINIGRTPFKWNSPNTGQFVYNNTMVMTAKANGDVSGWYQPDNGQQRAYGYQNNIMIYRGAGRFTPWIENGGNDPIDWTNNSWYPDKGVQWGSVFGTVAAAASGIGSTTPIFSGAPLRFTQDNVTVSDPFTSPVSLGATYLSEVTTTYTPALSGATAPKNSGVAISNITDGFSGAAPDRGAIISGRAAVSWGDRSGTSTVVPNQPTNLTAN